MVYREPASSVGHLSDHCPLILSRPFDDLLQERRRWWLVSVVFNRHRQVGSLLVLLSICFVLCLTLSEASSRAFGGIGLALVGLYFAVLFVIALYRGPVRSLMDELVREARAFPLEELLTRAFLLSNDVSGSAARRANLLVETQKRNAHREQMNAADTEMVDQSFFTALLSSHNALVREIGPIRSTQHDVGDCDGAGHYTTDGWAAMDGARSFHPEPGRSSSRFWGHYREIMRLLERYSALAQKLRPRSGLFSFRELVLYMLNGEEEEIRLALVEEIAALRSSLDRAESLVEEQVLNLGMVSAPEDAELAL